MDLDSIRSLVHNLAHKNMIGAQDDFNNIWADKLSAAIDDRRQAVAASIYGGQDDDAEPEEPSDENGSGDAE
jgi:hypothetical protein